MASYKSQFNPSRRIEDQPPYALRAPSTRLPQRSVTPTSTITPQLPVSSHSKLQKRRPSRDESVVPSRGTTSHRVPGPKPSVTGRTRQSSASPTVSSRLPKPDVVGTARTPSLVSGSSASTNDSPRSNMLRRKQSNIGVTSGRQDSQTREGSMSSQEEGQSGRPIGNGFKDPFGGTVLGISLPLSSSILAYAPSEIELQERQYEDMEAGPTDILPPPAPQYALSSTPSTRYSESPGAFSISSTPTSMSSYSPATALSSKTIHRTRQTSPLQNRPPMTRHRTPDEQTMRQNHALSSVRESSTSSSSTSTVMIDGARQRETQLAKRLPAVPSSPLPQVSLSSVGGKHFSPSEPAYKSQMQAPPELAHLADSPASPPDSRRPSRPSRDGASEIVGLRGPSPIIHSNITTFPPTHRRSSSTESKAGIMSNGKTRFGIPTKSSSRNPSPNPNLPEGAVPVSRLPTRGQTPDSQSETDKPRSRTVPAPTPISSPQKTSRFGFFSRRTKTEPVPAAPKPEKAQRRGPVAGTGHEGYGKYSFRSRSGSNAGAGSSGSIGQSISAGTTSESLNRTPASRKGSIASTTSGDMDEFFLERLQPVPIRGTGSSAELTRSPEPMMSGSSLALSSPSGEELHKIASNSSHNAFGQKRPTLLPSAMSDPVRSGASPVKKMNLGMRRPSESDDDTKRSFLPSLGPRRGSRSSKAIDSAPLSKVSSSEPKNKKAEKTPAKPSRKWNFFQRAHAAPRVESPAVVEAPATGNRVPPSRSVAHYALMDAQSGLGLDDIEQLMNEANSTPDEPSAPEEAVPQSDTAHITNGVERPERHHSMLLPPMPVLPHNFFTPPSRPASPKVFLRPDLPPPQRKLTVDTNSFSPSHPSSVADLTPVTDLSPSSSPFRPLSLADEVNVVSVPGVFSNNELDGTSHALLPVGPPPSNPPPRPSRLAQVGRIPQVVSRRTQERRPPSQSFSRPFVANQPRPSGPSRTSYDSIASVAATTGPAEPYPVLQGLAALSHNSTIAPLSPSAEESSRQSEFFKFAPRKDSEVSYSSSSGVWSFPPISGTAVLPSPGAPLSEDELWNEYDDLIDEVLLPAGTVKSLPENNHKAIKRHPSAEPLPLKTKASCTSSRSGVSVTGPSIPSLHLRRSRLLAVLHSAQSPTSPLSLSDYLHDHGERNLSVVDPVTGRLSFPSTVRMSTGSGTRTRPGSTRSSLPASLTLSARPSKATLSSSSDKDRESASSHRYRDTRLIEIAEAQSDGLVSMANLRFGALMTSKWLSFGRVLFSPAHFELKDPSEDRVLVIDGLGKDWSYYCALTYPEATIYNLGQGPSSATPTNNVSEPWSTLRNHRHISHASLAAAFPFPRGFFACVVLRFPPALPSSVHRSILSECKRVLRPGGHLELSVLDLDLVNMGNRARRAVRGLKVKMQVADEQISLRNISDEIMAGLGRKGFTECNRCFVGVPVAGKLPSSEDANTTDGKGSKRKDSTTSSIGKKAPKPEMSFSDLLNTQSTSDPATDEGITDMVARVGRWWYSRCYESLVLPEAGEPGAATSGNLLESSIWRDESLIKECEKRGTSFRLLIGYAQKPEVGVRRTVSV
ncbi:hypothetical protein P154DRAFT_204640 [Amniculicola lignicola CBS 123094]|uniref:Methyltransferase type 11 domain-containing protein n=1 Tax=Amniculicola lignicola CBS 123094 TaxID=1392246 RepID=A0A6A5WED3_9PLEO|nr:hypothetical protein P154DRAFT_204640 [Amniculicola lignicola CBS 123094]